MRVAQFVPVNLTEVLCTRQGQDLNLRGTQSWILKAFCLYEIDAIFTFILDSIQVYKPKESIALKTLPTDLNGNFGTVRVNI